MGIEDNYGNKANEMQLGAELSTVGDDYLRPHPNSGYPDTRQYIYKTDTLHICGRGENNEECQPQWKIHDNSLNYWKANSGSMRFCYHTPHSNTPPVCINQKLSPRGQQIDKVLNKGPFYPCNYKQIAELNPECGYDSSLDTTDSYCTANLKLHGDNNGNNVKFEIWKKDDKTSLAHLVDTKYAISTLGNKCN